MNEDFMTIRQMCDTFNVTPRTLRFYEAKELLAPKREGQKRLFTRRDRARLKLIIRGKRFGFSLEELRQLLDLYDADDRHEAQISKACEIGRHHLVDMMRRREDLDRAIAELKEQLDWGQQELTNLRRKTSAA